VTTEQLIADIDALVSADPEAGDIWRRALILGRDAIHVQFENGADARTALHMRTSVVDHILQQLWKRAGDDLASCALVAVGGYGRGELHPASDIDITVLLPAKHDETLREKISVWVTSLWDLNLEIGHSVRTVTESTRTAKKDLTVITNLMEARILCGDVSLFDRLQAAITPAKMWPAQKFYKAKIEEQEERYARFQTNAYRLEPNVKESQGGLRDFQTIAWVSQRVFGTDDLEPLVSNGLLEQDELDTLEEGIELLWRIRYLLHHETDRHEDRLLFDHQRSIAHSFGYTDDTNNRSIETLMQRFYRTVMALQRLNEILLQGLGGIISGVTAASKVVPINARFQLRNGFLEVTHDDVFMHTPSALLELFLIFGDTDEALKIKSNTVRLIRSHLKLINNRFRSDPVNRSTFIKIFSNPNKLTRTVRLMNRYGVMAAYLPAFDAIVGRMQYDLFHLYTVDEHTILVIRNIRRFTLTEFESEFPHCSIVAQTVLHPHVLYLTALFHDIAKGRGGDHSVLGAEDARVFAAEHNMRSYDRELMEWTVRNHLLMSITAQRKDIDDPAIQLEFAREVGTIDKLNHLYLLTVADIRATNPELWNSFKESLLHSLYQFTLQILQRGLGRPLDEDDVIARRQSHTLSLLDEGLHDDARITRLWETLGEDYFRQFRAPEIARHTELLLSNEDVDPLINLRHSPSRGSMEILIYITDHNSLFARITAALESLQLNVLSATIITSYAGFALDTFHVLELGGDLIEDPRRIQEIQDTLTRILAEKEELPTRSIQRASRRLKHFDIDTQVEFDLVAEREGVMGITEIRITAADRPGILSVIGECFMEADISVHGARISTLGERIDDVFLITTSDSTPLDNDNRMRLSELLCDRL